jgi:hypothetical protein
MDIESELYSTEQLRDLSQIVDVLRDGRESILRDWVDRVRDNTAIKTGEALTDPLLLDHLPQLFDAILDRLQLNRSREDAEQFAAVHGFTRRISGYDILESVIELLLFRHAIWTHLSAVGAAADGAFSAMERIDGMVDRAVISSLRAFLDPGAKMLVRRSAEDEPGDLPSAEESVPI